MTKRTSKQPTRNSLTERELALATGGLTAWGAATIDLKSVSGTLQLARGETIPNEESFDFAA